MKSPIASGASWFWTVAAGLLLVSVYLFNLGSLYAPTNGDEMVYLHIARLTSESGHWLPLVSDLQTPSGSEMRNTKPPLLFWQAMTAGFWGWDLSVLRLPYVLQTLLTALLVGLLTISIRRGSPQFNDSVKHGLFAAALYLGFFATYRYGRPVLPSSTESLFLFAVCALVVQRQLNQKVHLAWLAVGAGLLMIPALLSKSFVLAAPVGLWLFAALWMTREPFGLSLSKAGLQKFWQCAWPSTLAVVIGLSGFALWFIADPNPAAVWREFVIGENFSTKFSESRSDSLLAIVFAPLINAGLLAPLVAGLLWVLAQDGWSAIRSRSLPSVTSQAGLAKVLLGLWVGVWLLIFAMPSQRSARYVIPIMPAIAVLLALYSGRIAKLWWLLTLGLIATATAALGWISYALAQVVDYSVGYFAGLAGLFVICVLGLAIQRWQMAITSLSAVAWLGLLGALAMPFDGPAGRFDANRTAHLAGTMIWVPQNFNAQFERYRFIVPKVQPIGYPAESGVPASFQRGEILSSRLVLRSRHAPGEVTLAGLSTLEGVQKLLVEREVLVSAK